MQFSGQSEISRKAATGNSGRRASKEFRREQLINATIDSLAERGYAATTLADVADGAGLSRGIVNFHFESKEKLLIETLNYLSNEYTANWRNALADAGDDPAGRLHAIILADLDERICSPRKVAAWFAFFSEAATRPAYQELCWARDDDYLGELFRVCLALADDGGYDFDPRKMADTLYAMQEGFWLRLMIDARSFSRSTAVETALAAVGALCPRHFEIDGTVRK